MPKQIKSNHQKVNEFINALNIMQPFVIKKAFEQAHQDRGKLLELVEDIKTTIYFNMGKIEDSKMYDEFEALLKKLESEAGETKSNCKFYNWNDNLDYPSYPREYGARCEHHNEFFSKASGQLKPDCQTCPDYKPKRDQDSREIHNCEEIKKVMREERK